MCDHNPEKLVRIEFFAGFETYDVHMCECGALIDCGAEENWGTERLPMSQAELTQLIRDLFNKKLTDALKLLSGAMKL